MLRPGLLILVAVAVLSGAARDARATTPGGAVRLQALLGAAKVPVGRGKNPAASTFPAAWAAFKRFARERDGELVYGFGVFESQYYGTSFEVELTRGAVHLVVHFPVAAYTAITRGLRAMPCVAGGGCMFRCFFVGDDALVPKPCSVVPGGAGGYRPSVMTLRASETGGSDASAQRRRWIAAVGSSPVFWALLFRHVRPDGYDVWQASAG
jgi:hypothetical protein